MTLSPMFTARCRAAARRSSLALIALATISFCSCHSGGASGWMAGGVAGAPGGYPAGGQQMASTYTSGGLATGGAATATMMAPPERSLFGIAMPPAPLPQTIVSPWAPPGISLPWPHDEYLADGGDKEVPVTVNAQGQVNGLELEDTIVHFDTLDGRTLVEPSNRVNIYAPRFAAVRAVEETRSSKRRDQIEASHAPVGPQVEIDRWVATTAMQPVQPIDDTGVRQVSIAHLRQGQSILLAREFPNAAQNRVSAHEDFEIIRLGTFDETEKVRLMESVDAAITWEGDQALQVVIDRVEAKVDTGDQKAEQTYRVDTPQNPRLRVVKVASTNQARPGDVVDFTIRYDNMGDAPIGNVTLIDNLTTRLEYVEGSAKSSRDAAFFADPNAGDSLALRWEFAEPLDPGQGGLVRFQCRVR